MNARAQVAREDRHDWRVNPAHYTAHDGPETRSAAVRRTRSKAMRQPWE
jgi:hypothetical protein